MTGVQTCALPISGSSLDPSAEPGTKMTTKIGFDLTKPLVAKGKSFDIADFPKVDINKYF